MLLYKRCTLDLVAVKKSSFWLIGMILCNKQSTAGQSLPLTEDCDDFLVLGIVDFLL